MPEFWNNDVTIYTSSYNTQTKTTAWQVYHCSNCFFKATKATQFSDKALYDDCRYMVRIPQNSFPATVGWLTSGSIIVCGNVSDIIANNASGNDVLKKYPDKAFKVNSTSDNTCALLPHLWAGGA